MADFAALTIQSGTHTQLQSTNYLLAGLGVKPRAAGNFEIYSGGGGTFIDVLGDLRVGANQNLTIASGTSGVDFSGGSGAFKTTTGAVTVGPGAVTVSGVTSFTAAGTALSVTNNATISGVLSLLGPLNMAGDIAIFDTERVLFNDNHLYLNNAYTTTTPVTGGLVVNYSPTATATTVNGVYVAGIAATSNPTVITTGSGTFAAADLVQISGSFKNDGLYEVLSHVGTTLTIRGVGVTATVEDFTESQLTAGASDAATITKVSVSVMRAGTDGLWEVGLGAVTPLSFADVSTGATTDLQAAYVNGNTITTSAGEGNVTINGDQDFIIAGSVDAAWSTTGGFTSTSMTGVVNLTTTAAMTMRGGGISVFGDDIATLRFDGAGAVSGTGMTSVALAPSGAITLTAGAASVWSTGAGSLTIDSAAALSIGASTATSLAIGHSGVTTTVTGNLTQLTGLFSLTGNGASSITSSGVITITSAGNTVWSTSSGALRLDATAALNLGTISATAVNVGHAGITTTVVGAVAITADAASSFTTSAGALTLQGATDVTVNGQAGSINLQTGGSSRLIIAAAAATVQAGVTLETTGTGNINLPQNASARFQIEGVATASTVTAANLATLTASAVSNADALHTHSGVSASVVGVTGTSTIAGITAGAPVVFINSGGVPRAVYADANGAGELSNVVGLNLTAVGGVASVTIIVSGRVSVPDAGFASVPAVTDVGKMVFLSETAGLLTLTAPTTTGSTVVRVGYVATGGSGAAQVIVSIGTATVL